MIDDLSYLLLESARRNLGLRNLVGKMTTIDDFVGLYLFYFLYLSCTCISTSGQNR